MAKKAKRTAAKVPENRELKQLAAAPLAGVTGVVHGNAAGSKGQGETSWTLMFELRPWRREGGEVRTAALFVRKRALTEAELKRFMASIRGGSVLKLRARVVDETVSGRAAALATRIEKAGRGDAELRRGAKAVRTPVVKEEELFGRLTLDRRGGCYTGKGTWDGRAVKVELEGETPGELEGVMKTARALWKNQTAWAKRIGRFAVKEMLADKNDGWLEEGEKPVTAEQFLKRMKLVAVNVGADGAFSFWHEDGGLFWGHMIRVVGNLKEG